MAFEALVPLKPAALRSPVAVAMQRRGGNALPSFVIFIEPEFGQAIDIANGTLVSCHVGNGEHGGLLRLTRDDAGPFTARMLRSGLVVDLGYVERFGHRSQVKECVEVRTTGPDAGLMIRLPAWTGYKHSKSTIPQEASGTAREAPSTGSGTAAAKPRAGTKSAPPPSSKPRLPPPDTAPARASIAGNAVMIAGVTIDKTLGQETISTGLGTIDTSRRGAMLVEALLRANFLPVDASRCIRELWGNSRPHGVETLLDIVISDLKSLQAIGLKVERLKGIGVKLTLLS